MANTICIFDVCGTPVDMAPAARRAAGEPGREAVCDTWPRIASDWHAKQLQDTWLRAVGRDAAGAAGYGLTTVCASRADERGDRLCAAPHRLVADLSPIPDFL